MGPTWVLSAPGGPHVGPMNLAIRAVAIFMVIVYSCLCSISHNIYICFIFGMVIIKILRGLYVICLPISFMISIPVKGLRPVQVGFVVTRHEGTCKQQVKSWGRRSRDLMNCSHEPECIVTTNLDRSVLIMIITWRFQYRLVNVSILHLKFEYGAGSNSQFRCYSHCYVT